MKLKASNIKEYLIHLGIIIGIIILLLIIFFYAYLPSTTNHGETITLPNLVGMSYEEIDEFLTSRDLRYQVRSDSSFDEKYPALTILNQHPKAGSQVKINRKVYLTLNARKPPLVSMPNLNDRSLVNAENTLRDMGLKIGEIDYVPDLAQNAVLKQLYQGEPIQQGDFVPQGAKIDLVVGDGYGSQAFDMPDLIAMEYGDAKVYILGLRLQMGSILNQDVDPEFTGLIMEQNPEAGSEVRSGQLVDLWIGNLNETDTLSVDQDATRPYDSGQ